MHRVYVVLVARTDRQSVSCPVCARVYICVRRFKFLTIFFFLFVVVCFVVVVVVQVYRAEGESAERTVFIFIVLNSLGVLFLDQTLLSVCVFSRSCLYHT